MFKKKKKWMNLPLIRLKVEVGYGDSTSPLGENCESEKNTFLVHCIRAGELRFYVFDFKCTLSLICRFFDRFILTSRALELILYDFSSDFIMNM